MDEEVNRDENGEADGMNLEVDSKHEVMGDDLDDDDDDDDDDDKVDDDFRLYFVVTGSNTV